ncbi:MAG TPA: MFS transporter [Casimicrobiaceae bacterium]|nr:MFS transporter [Casimicrobiaceae bacterium]
MTQHAVVPFSRIYLPFAAGYLMSYLYRVVTAVISPELSRDLDLPPSALGLLTSAYFIAFAATQIPAGILLDRYGPRRVEPVLLTVAAVGAFGFAASGGLAGLTVARALVGAGVAVCLMAPLKGVAVWFPPQRQAPLAGWLMVAGGAGALVATTPVELALRHVDWRMLFAGFGVATAAVACAIAWRVPDLPRVGTPPSIADQLRGVRRVFGQPRFWWIMPVGAVGMGSFMAIQGLWSVTWMMEVEGRTRADAAGLLLAMSITSLAGYLGLGTLATHLARRGFVARHFYLVGWTLNFVGLAAIVARVPGGFLWWCFYGFGAAANVLAFTLVNEGFPSSLAGRASTAINLAMFSGSFVVQWGVGVIVDAVRLATGGGVADGLRVAYAAVLSLVAAAYLWFLAGWRRHAGATRPAED